MAKGRRQKRKGTPDRPRRAIGTGRDAAQLAMAQHRAGDLHKAKILYRRVVEAHPENAEAWHGLGILYAQAGAADRAVVCLETAVGLDRDNASYKSDLGNALVANGRTDDAIACYRGAFVSGVYYVQLPEVVKAGAGGNAGHIEFGRPRDERTGDPAPGAYLTRTVAPAEGTMVLFPSYLWHNTIPFESEQDRISISFDVFPA